MVHRKGSQMVVADALSRAVEAIDILNFSKSNDKWYKSLVNNVTEFPERFYQYRIENGILYKSFSDKKTRLGYVSKWKIVVPEDQRRQVIDECHSPPTSGHGGYHKTKDRVQRTYFLPQLDAQIRAFVRDYETCKSSKHSNVIQRAPMGNFRKPLSPWHTIYIDFIGPLNGNCYILTIVDSFSKFVHAEPLKIATSKCLIKFLRDNIFLTFGVAEIVITDNGSQFTSSDFQNFLKEFNVRHCPVSMYHPQANAAEAANKSLETSIRAYVKDNADHREWDKHLSPITCAMNTSVHTATKLSPYFINFGRNMILSGKEYQTSMLDKNKVNPPEERFDKIRTMVEQNLLKAYEKSKQKYDLRARPVEFSIGDIVWKTNHRQSDAMKYISAKLLGNVKCKVKRKIGTSSYELEDLNGKSLGVFSANQLKK